MEQIYLGVEVAGVGLGVTGGSFTLCVDWTRAPGAVEFLTGAAGGSVGG